MTQRLIGSVGRLGLARLRSPIIRRAGWGLADQALSSLTNFAVGIFVARAVNPVDFGAFSLAFVAYTVCLNASRALAATPLVVRYSGTEPEIWRNGVRQATGTAIVVGILAAFVFVAVGAATGGTLRAAFFAMAIVMPGLLLQDTWRFAFFAAGRGAWAFVNDGVWAIVLVPAFIVVSLRQDSPVFSLTLAWGVAATVAALFGLVQCRIIPWPASIVVWLRSQRDLAPRYLVEFLTLSGAAQAALALVGVIAGLAAVGSIRAAQLLLGPLHVLFMGAQLVAVPEAVMLAQRSTRTLRAAAGLIGLLEAGVAGAWGVFLLLMPAAIGVALLGANWEAARFVLPAMTVWLIGSSLQEGGTIGLRGLAAANRSLRARVVSASLVLIVVIPGALGGGAAGAAGAIAAATMLGAAVWWWEFLRGVDEAGAKVSGGTPQT